MTFKRSVHIEAPVEKVFDFFRDPRNWQGIEELGVVFKDVRLTDEGVGTSYSWIARVAGLRIEGSNVFTEFLPNKRIVDRSSWSFEGIWTYSFEPEGSGTKMTIENSQVSFWRIPPLGWLMDYIAKGHEPVIYRLKAVMEAARG